MNIGNYIMTPVVRQAVPPPPPPSQVSSALNAASLVAQNVSQQTATQTSLAAQAVGNADTSRAGQGRGQSSDTGDTRANTLNARTNGTAVGSSRGGNLNIRV